MLQHTRSAAALLSLAEAELVVAQVEDGGVGANEDITCSKHT